MTILSRLSFLEHNCFNYLLCENMKIKNNDLWQRFFSSLADKLLRFRWLGIIAVVLLTVFFAYQMQGLKFDYASQVGWKVFRMFSDYNCCKKGIARKE